MFRVSETKERIFTISAKLIALEDMRYVTQRPYPDGGNSVTSRYYTYKKDETVFVWFSKRDLVSVGDLMDLKTLVSLGKLVPKPVPFN